MSALGPEAPLQPAAKPRAIRGFSDGLRYPSLLLAVTVRAHPGDRVWLREAGTALAAALSCPEPDAQYGSAPAQAGPAVAALLFWTRQIQHAAELPVLDFGIVVGMTPARVHLRIPTFVHAFGPTSAVVDWLLGLFALAAARDALDRHMEGLPPLVDELKRRLAVSATIPRLLRAAHGLGLPCIELAGGVFQVGQGSRSRWLESTLTDQTAQIGVRFARNKQLGAAILRQAGLPAPPHLMVPDVEAALEAAETIRYPVVVKPADTEGGKAVACGLTTPAEVAAAFARALVHSPNILVEKHFEGHDYRLTVFGSELIWAAERIPGGVTGDGRSTVAALVEEQSAARARDASVAGGKYRLEIDDEALEMLAKVGLRVHSVPAAGRFVRLRRAANLALGGTVRAAMHEVHPDNAELAIRAARALRLDLAGVDLLIPDISRSWLEVGAAICEVNAQPDLGISGPHIYGELLQKLLPAGGRIPIVVVFGAPPESEVGQDIADQLAASGGIVGRAGRDGVFVGAETIHPPTGCHHGAQILMADTTVEAAVVSVHDADLIQNGLPFDRFDVLVIAGEEVEVPPALAAGRQEVADRMLRSLLPMCTGTVLSIEGARPPSPNLLRGSPGAWHADPVPAGEAGSRVAGFLADRESRAPSGA